MIKVDMREQVVDVPPQGVITKDNVVVEVDAVVYYEVTDPIKVTYNVANFYTAATKLAQTNLRNLIGDMALDESLTSRETINTQLRQILDDATDKVLDTDKIIDPFNGLDDLGNRVVRTVNKTCFQSDAARLLRCVRIAAELEFTIDGDTSRLIRNDSRLIASVAGERTREELLRLLALPLASNWLAYLDNAGLLTALIPELEASRGVDQPKMHVWDVLEHSLQTVSTVEFLLRENKLDYAVEDVLAMVPWSEDISRHFGEEISHGSTHRSNSKGVTAVLST